MLVSVKLVRLFLLVQLQCWASQSEVEIAVEEITSESQRCELGEGPHWDVARQSLYYVDIVAPAILRYCSKSGEIYRATVNGNNSPIGFISPVKNRRDEFIIGAGRRIVLIRWDGLSKEATIIKSLGEVDQTQTENRINDGKIDPKGVLFFGTMGDEAKFDLNETRVGTFYSFKNSTAKGIKFNVGISNGLTWDVKHKKFYYIDSVTRDIKQFDYDPSSSKISNESILFDLNLSHTGIKFAADGMTIDEDGNLYVATWGGSRVIVINPKTREIIREIPMPTAQITSLAFGGPGLDILYVTSAGRPKPQPAPAGGLFKITGLGVKGRPMNEFKLY